MLIIALEASSTGVARGVLSLPPIAYLGRVSYATYLWHWPLIVLIRQDHTLSRTSLFAIVAIAATGLAVLSFHVIEHPIRAAVHSIATGVRSSPSD